MPAGDAISATGLYKAYGGVKALTDMNLSVRRGCVHAVLGENGAGKSTLMKILAGAVQPDRGQIRVDGRAVDLSTPAAAGRHGIGIVYQELAIFPERSILANLFPADQPTRWGLVSRRAMERAAGPMLAKMGLALPTGTPLSALGVGERQLVELTRLMIRHPKILILDEPNSALNEMETQHLFGVLRELTADGVTIIYVSHRLEEVFRIADQISVMRNGQLVWTKDRALTSPDEVVRSMVGAQEAELFPPRLGSAARRIGRPLRVDGLCVGQEIRDVTFQAQPGEVVGLAGLDGSGTATLLGALFGTRQITSGTLEYPDSGQPLRSPTQAARRRISLVPADRRGQGLMLDRSVQFNASQVRMGAAKHKVWISTAEMRAAVRRQAEGLNITPPDPDLPVSALSGGNQQKVVIAKWLEIAPQVFLLDDPTRGIDVGAKKEIYRLIRKISNDGGIVLFRSSELPELAGLADRILVMFRGRLAGEMTGRETTTAGLLHAINTGVL